jgi:hypothetical protein
MCWLTRERLAIEVTAVRFIDHAGDDRARGSASRGDVKAIMDSRGQLAGHRPGFLYQAGALVADSERIRSLQMLLQVRTRSGALG